MPPEPIGVVPVGLRVEGRRVLVVGAGPIAARKAAPYVDHGAIVTVVAPEHSADMDRLEVAHRHHRAVDATDLDDVWLVVTATGDPVVDGWVFAQAESRRIWCNAADDPTHCSVILPAVCRRGPLTVTIATGGQSPAAASWLRRRVEALLDQPTLAVVEAAARARAVLRSRGIATEVPAWAEILDERGLELATAGRVDELERALVDRVAADRVGAGGRV